MRAIQIVRHGAVWRFDFDPTAFLHHMVRNIMGCLVYIGQGYLPRTAGVVLGVLLFALTLFLTWKQRRNRALHGLAPHSLVRDLLRVALIGAGGIGFDVAEYLVHEGHSPTLDLAEWMKEWGV